MMAGLLARGSVRIHPFPAFGQWDVVNALSAYSCGGSHGFGPFWVVLTVFPFQPLQGHLEAAPSARHLAQFHQSGNAGSRSSNILIVYVTLFYYMFCVKRRRRRVSRQVLLVPCLECCRNISGLGGDSDAVFPR